jgi:hypothetical protein
LKPGLLLLLAHLMPNYQLPGQVNTPPGGWGSSALRLLQPLLAALSEHVPHPGRTNVGGALPGSAAVDPFCVDLLKQMVLLVNAAGRLPQLAVTLSRCGFAQLAHKVAQHLYAAGDLQRATW